MLKEKEQKFGIWQKRAFTLSYLPTWLISGIVQIWVFSFYYMAIRLDVFYIMMAYIIWTIWNGFNDPLIGYLSDRTKTRWGRRKPYIMVGTIPVIIISILLWTPTTSSTISTFIYLVITLFAFDTFYTMLELPYDCLFPELYPSAEERAQVNTLKEIFSIIGLFLAFIIPSIFINDMIAIEGYQLSGIVISCIIGITLFISLKWGVKERPEFKNDNKPEFGFFQGLKYTLKNRGFILYTLMFFGFEYIQLLQSTLIPLLCEIVLKVEGTIEIGIMLGLLLAIAIATVIFWKKLDLKCGSKFAFFIALCSYFIASIPLLFVIEYYSALVVVAFMGFGYGGMMYFIYLLIADVIDDDELKTGVRREGTFFGITSFFMRFAGVFSILTIGLVFEGADWSQYNPIFTDRTLITLALRILLFVFPAIALGLLCLCLYFYPYPKNRVMALKKEMAELHKIKREKISNSKSI